MAEVSHLEAAFERITVNDENSDELVAPYKPKVRRLDMTARAVPDTCRLPPPRR